MGKVSETLLVKYLFGGRKFFDKVGKTIFFDLLHLRRIFMDGQASR
jgi:hypothetical protein